MMNTTFEELRLTGRLPSPPGVGLRILKLTQREDCSAQEIGETIMADAVLTGTLLRIANSVLSGGVRPITTVTEATMRLGVRAVRNVGLGLSLVSAYRVGKCEHFDYDHYWSVSLARAVAAQRISEKLRYSVPAEAYVVGLLSDIGRLALATVYPTEFSTLLASFDPRDESALRLAERERFEIDHGEIGSYLLEEWGLPQVYSQAVMTYENPPQINVASSGELALVTNILRFAALFANVCTANQADARTPWGRYVAELEVMRITMRLEPGAFDEFLNAIAREWREWGTVMHIPTPKPSDFSKLPEIAQRSTSPEPSAPSVASRSPQADVSEPPLLAASSSQDARGLRILAVDDDPMSLKLLERHLVRAGHHVQCASDGNEALQIALDTNPQVVVADWMMPSLDGIELCKALRRIECGRDMFFLLLTGRGEEDRIVEAFDAGVDDYVVKPFIPKLLIARIKGGQRVIELKEKVEHDRQTMMKQVAELGLLTRKLRTAAMTDMLTELPNRRYAMRRLEQEWDASVRHNKPLSVIMIDIDHFKQVNDLHGHDVGDVVLKETANTLRNTTRQGEDTARLGGEEFIVVCTNTNLDQAMACAERIRAAVESHTISCGTFQKHVTVSLGVAQRGPGITSMSALIKSADEAVYLAKDAGRNLVRAAMPPGARSKSA
jgi:diguanylate cyclase (GGDEF)-like protein